eukprot:COSAG05_NODE_2586_length_2871_cov_21.775758_5_plen_94_part_00
MLAVGIICECFVSSHARQVRSRVMGVQATPEVAVAASDDGCIYLWARGGGRGAQSSHKFPYITPNKVYLLIICARWIDLYWNMLVYEMIRCMV